MKATDNLAPQVRTTLETLEKITTPPEVLNTIRHYADRDVAIRGQQFRPEKEQQQLADERAHATREIAGAIRNLEATAAAERDRELAQVESELKQARVIPNRQLGETGDDYGAKLTRQLIGEQRDVLAATQASTEVQLALEVRDVGELEVLLADAIDGGHPARIRPVSQAVRLQLERLAQAETRSSAASRPAAAALFRVDAMVKAWREQAAERSPLARKQKIQARYEARVGEYRQQTLRAAGQFGLRDAVENALGNVTTPRHTMPREQQ